MTSLVSSRTETKVRPRELVENTTIAMEPRFWVGFHTIGCRIFVILFKIFNNYHFFFLFIG
jgi:hypothetical protein